MLRQEFTLKSPMRILQKETGGGLGKGNLGIFMARAGVGKTACLIHVALDNLFKHQKVVHVGIGESLEDVQVWYNEILSDLYKTFDIRDPDKTQEEIDRNRIILSYTPETFTVKRLIRDMNDIAQDGTFTPDLILIDGFPFEEQDVAWDTLAAFKYAAEEQDIEIWFSARTHRESDIQNDRGIPAPCHEVDDLFSLIIMLDPKDDAVHLKLLKNFDQPVGADLPIKLNPHTMLLMDE